MAAYDFIDVGEAEPSEEEQNELVLAALGLRRSLPYGRDEKPRQS